MSTIAAAAAAAAATAASKAALCACGVGGGGCLATLACKHADTTGSPAQHAARHSTA